MASGSGGSIGQSSTKASSTDVIVSTVSEGLANLSLDMTGGEDVKSLLECPICMNIFVPPILQCPRGHLSCNTCIPQLKQCPSCEGPVGTAHNLALESILQTISFSCNHHSKGCNELLKIQGLQQHHEQCDYRLLKCHLSDMDDCNGTLLYLTDTLSHLQATHKLKTVKSGNGPQNVFKSEKLAVLREDGEDDIPWDGELFHFDGNNFVSLIRSNGPLTYGGFYLIGSKSDASKYSVTIAIQKYGLEDAIFNYEVTTKFTSIRDFQEVWEDGKLPLELILHRDVLRRDTKGFSKREIVEEKLYSYWSLVYTINKI